MERNSTTAPNGASALTIRQQWAANFEAWKAAKVRFDLIDAAHTTAHQEAGGKASPALTKLDTAHNSLGDDEAKKRSALTLTPAPNYEAVLLKMQLLFGQEYAELGAEDEYISAHHRSTTDTLMADVERLQGEAAHRMGPMSQSRMDALIKSACSAPVATTREGGVA